MTSYTYYAAPLWDYTTFEINNGDAGEIEESEMSVPIYPNGDGNEEPIGEAIVKVIAPKGYELKSKDYERLGELINEN